MLPLCLVCHLLHYVPPHCPSWWFSRWRCCFERPALSSIELYSITQKVKYLERILELLHNQGLCAKALPLVVVESLALLL